MSKAHAARIRNITWLAVLLFTAILVLTSAFASRAEALVYWANYDSIGRANLDGTGANQRFIDVPGGAGGVAVDGAHLYWGGFSDGGPSVGRASLDGSQADHDFVTGATGFPTGVAVDAGHIYWSEAGYFGRGGIGRANLDGSGANEDFIDASKPAGVAVDDAHVYWANRRHCRGGECTGTDAIARANLDGTGVDRSFIEVSGEPGGVAVDGAHLYWGAYSAGRWRIGRGSLDGTGVDHQFIANPSGFPTGVAVDEAHIYWTQGSLATPGAIGRASLDGSGLEQGFVATQAAVPRGVAVDAVSATAPPSNEFALGKLRRNSRRGTATLTVVVPHAGELALSTTRRVIGRETRADTKGSVKLLVEPRGGAKKRLRRRGKAKVKATVSYTPNGGEQSTRSRRVRLRKSIDGANG